MARREGALKGAYVAKAETEDLDLIIIATGSEVQHALEAAKDMPGARVVSMPCMELYERQSDDYKESVLPSTCTKYTVQHVRHLTGPIHKVKGPVSCRTCCTLTPKETVMHSGRKSTGLWLCNNVVLRSWQLAHILLHESVCVTVCVCVCVRGPFPPHSKTDRDLRYN